MKNYTNYITYSHRKRLLEEYGEFFVLTGKDFDEQTFDSMEDMDLAAAEFLDVDVEDLVAREAGNEVYYYASEEDADSDKDGSKFVLKGTINDEQEPYEHEDYEEEDEDSEAEAVEPELPSEDDEEKIVEPVENEPVTDDESEEEEPEEVTDEDVKKVSDVAEKYGYKEVSSGVMRRYGVVSFQKKDNPEISFMYWPSGEWEHSEAGEGDGLSELEVVLSLKDGE